MIFGKKKFLSKLRVSLMDSFDLLQIKGIVCTLIFWQDSERKTTLCPIKGRCCVSSYLLMQENSHKRK